MRHLRDIRRKKMKSTSHIRTLSSNNSFEIALKMKAIALMFLITHKCKSLYEFMKRTCLTFSKDVNSEFKQFS